MMARLECTPIDLTTLTRQSGVPFSMPGLSNCFAITLCAYLFLICPTHASYEVWMADQGGVNGTTINIYREADLMSLINAPETLDISSLIPSALITTGAALQRLHGIVQSPNRRYATLNFVGSAHLVIIDTRSRKPLCLFRTTGTSSGRQNHMSFWTSDGRALLISNQNGRMLERVGVSYNSQGAAQSFTFEAHASLDMVGGDRILAQPIAVDLDLSDTVSCTVAGQVANLQPVTTPIGSLKQAAGVRPANTVICAIPVTGRPHVLVTLGGGGLFVADYSVTPMAIVAEYDITHIRSAGCGGVNAGNFIYINSGTPAAGVSGFALYRLPKEFPRAPLFAPGSNLPEIVASFEDPLNGQSVPSSSRRDAHGMVLSQLSGGLIHQFDRTQDQVDVFSTAVYPGAVFPASSNPSILAPLASYSLRSSGVCGTTPGAPIVDGSPLTNKPTPDLADISPAGDYIFVALRGPNPITVAHAAVGSCPGLGIIKLDSSGVRGSLVAVLPTFIPGNATDGSVRNLSDNHAATMIHEESCRQSGHRHDRRQLR